VLFRNEETELYSELDVTKTTVNTTKTQIVTPYANKFFIVHHNTEETIYIGDGTSDGYPLPANTRLELSNMKKDDGNDIYAIATGDVIIYCVGVV
jgi:hypothetical protein